MALELISTIDSCEQANKIKEASLVIKKFGLIQCLAQPDIPFQNQGLTWQFKCAKEFYVKYNYFFQIQPMSFQATPLRNPFSSYLKQFPSPTYVPSQSYSILPKLCQALTISLETFTFYELQNISRLAEKAKQAKKLDQVKAVVIQLLSSDEEVPELNQKVIGWKEKGETANKLWTAENQEKTDLSKDNLDFQKQQPLSHQQPTFHSVRKNCLIRKQKPNKIALKLIKQKHSYIQKYLDLTDIVHIKNSPLSARELGIKRQALLMRNVINWEQTVKNRKQRREIRMLKN